MCVGGGLHVRACARARVCSECVCMSACVLARACARVCVCVCVFWGKGLFSLHFCASLSFYFHHRNAATELCVCLLVFCGQNPAICPTVG